MVAHGRDNKGEIIMEKILEKAKELGQMIAKSEQFEAIKIAEENQAADPEAEKLMAQFTKKQQELSEKMAKPDITKEEFEAIKKEAQEEFEKICENKNINAYLEANRAFSNLINQVNTIIGYFVKGGDAGGCSGSCSTCGGCH